MFDSHCHLQFDAFDACDVVAEARESGLRGVIAADFDSERRDRLVSLAQQDGVWATCGLHPWAIPEDDDTVGYELEQVEKALETHPWVGVGEFGLDAKRSGSIPMERQVEVARRHFEWASELDLPIVMHVVHAEDVLLDLLETLGFEGRGMCHGFSGTPEQAKKFVDRGLHISIGTNAVRGNVGRIREVCRAIPRSSMLVETDAPSRPPDGVDGPNHPRYLNLVIGAVADFVSEEPDEIARQTEENARALFRLDPITL